MADENIPRRRFLQGAGAVATALGTTLNAEAQPVLPTERTAAAQPGNEPLLTLTATEAAFLSAAYDTIIPADALSPSGTDCGLVNYIDRQLAGAWGNGARLYRSGPFVPGKPEQGYQLSLTPREFFAAGIKAANEWSRKTYGKEFDRLAPADREAALKTMEAGKAEFADISGKQFFEALLQSAMEGFFADPIYGGNRDKVSWRMIGYPGLPAAYADKALEYRGQEGRDRAASQSLTFPKESDHGQDFERSRRRHGRHGLVRQHHGARAHQGGPYGGRARARRRPFAARRLRVAPHPRRAQISAALRAHARYRGRDAHVPQQSIGARAADAAMGGAPARRRCGRSRHALERHHLALFSERIRAAKPFDVALRRNAIPEDMTIQDWGVTYDDLEPHYDRFEKLCGTSGKAGNLRGQKIEGGNVFEGPRGNDYPNRPLIMSQAGLIFTKAAQSLGYHPFPTPASNSSAAYTNPEGMTIGQCQYCGHCEFFGCESNAKASPLVCILPALRQDKRFELRSQAYVSRLIYEKAAKKVRAVVYIDRRTGEEIEQPADLVVLCAYPFNNTLLLLTAGIGEPYDPVTAKGVVGKNYCQQTNSSVTLFVDDEINPFIGTGSSPAAIDDFQGDNFDHGGLGFFGGGFISPVVSGGRPIQVRAVPPGTPRWGSAWKDATARWYNHSFPITTHGINYAHRNHYLDLDPTYRDAIGRPLVRMTYNYTDNDYKMSAFLTAKATEIARAANARIVGTPQPRRGNYGINNGLSSHHTGGAIMGSDPRTSAINRYLQSWEASNLFVMGGAAFPQNAGHNPTGTIGALTYWSAKAITSQYLKSPGPLVPA